MTLGEKLKRLRYRLGLSLAQLAKKSKIHKVCIVCYENGSRYPGVDNLRKLSNALEVSMGAFQRCEPYKKRVKRKKKVISFDDFMEWQRAVVRDEMGEGWRGVG